MSTIQSAATGNQEQKTVLEKCGRLFQAFLRNNFMIHAIPEVVPVEERGYLLMLKTDDPQAGADRINEIARGMVHRGVMLDEIAMADQRGDIHCIVVPLALSAIQDVANKATARGQARTLAPA